MKKVLFYYPSNKRSIQIETTIFEIQKLGHEIILLTTCNKGLLHKELEINGINTFQYISRFSFSPFYYINQIFYLISFCKKNKIDVILSNLQHANFISVLAQFFLKARVIHFRHHFKFSKGNYGITLKINKTELFFDKIINLFSKKIIVPSSGVFEGIKKHEKINIQKLDIIPYLYDFSKYGSPDLNNVELIKKQFPAKIRIIMVARLIPFKRHKLILPIFKKLIEENFDIQIIILDEGQEKENLQSYIKQNQLESRIHLIGFTTNFLDYMKASDILIHPSITEASNNVVKEIGLMKKTVAVCKGVGDFDEYILEQTNGFFMDISKPELDAEQIIRSIYAKPEQIELLGSNLKETILNKFSSNDTTIKLYEKLINERISS